MPDHGQRPPNTVRRVGGSGGDTLIEPWTDIGEVPGQQFRHAVHRVVGDALDHAAQVGLRVEAVQLGGLCRLLNYAERISFLHKWP